MTHPAPDPRDPDHPVDRLVREHLDAEAARTDPAAVLRRVNAARAATPQSSLRRWLGGVAVGAAVAAGIAVFFLVGMPDEPQVAAAETAWDLVEKARAAHSQPADRCYDVVAEWDPIPFRRMKLEPLVRKSRLWTRGDQFWIESQTPDGRKVAWGQTADGRVWVVPFRKRGLVYDPDEVGEPITRYCELMSLRVVATLGDALRECHLARRDSGRPGEPIRIMASRFPAPGNPNPRFSQLELELDPDTKVIRRAMLRRLVHGEIVGTLRFSLAETATLPDDQYDVRGHLDPDGIVLDGRAKLPPKLPGLVPFDPRAKFRDEMLKRMQDRVK